MLAGHKALFMRAALCASQETPINDFKHTYVLPVWSERDLTPNDKLGQVRSQGSIELTPPLKD